MLLLAAVVQSSICDLAKLLVPAMLLADTIVLANTIVLASTFVLAGHFRSQHTQSFSPQCSFWPPM